MVRRALCVLVVFLLISGCSKNSLETDAEPVVLRVISAGGPNRLSEEAAVLRFQEKYPDIQVELLAAPGRDYYVKALAILAAGSDLDILWMGSGFGLFAWRGALLPLDSFLESDPDFDLGRYEPEVVNWYRHEGDLLGIPYGIDLQLMVYNRNAFQAAGIPEPSPDWTFTEYLKIAGELSRFGKEHATACRYGAGVDKIAPYYFGLSLVDENGLRSGLRGEVAEEWLRTNVELLRNGGDFLRVGAQGTLDRLGEFLQERVAMVEAYTWDVGELRNRAQFPWALAVNPIGADGKRAGWASSSGFSISARTKHPKESWLLLKELVGAEMQVSLMATTIPARRDLQAQYLEVNNVPGSNLKGMLEMIPFMRELPRIPELLEVSQELDYWFELALQEDSDVKEIVPQMSHGIDRILATSPARE